MYSGTVYPFCLLKLTINSFVSEVVMESLMESHFDSLQSSSVQADSSTLCINPNTVASSANVMSKLVLWVGVPTAPTYSLARLSPGCAGSREVGSVRIPEEHLCCQSDESPV